VIIAATREFYIVGGFWNHKRFKTFFKPFSRIPVAIIPFVQLIRNSILCNDGEKGLFEFFLGYHLRRKKFKA
jgi:hypothetical protein